MNEKLIITPFSNENIKEKDPEKSLELQMQDAILGPVIQYVRKQLESRTEKVLSDDVEDYFLDEKAKFIVMNDGLMVPRAGKDDRLADNLDNVLAHFETPGKITLPYAQHQKLERVFTSIQLPENHNIADFMQRTEAEYLKLLIYYAKVRSFDDLNTIFD